MTITDTSFQSMDMDKFAIDEIIYASDVQMILQNQNHLYKLATGNDLAGGANPAAGHDHEEHGGVKIPLYLAFPIGMVSAPRLTGASTNLPFMRIASNADATDYLFAQPSPHPSVSNTVVSQEHRIWVDGDYESYFADSDWLTIDDTSLTGRYPFKSATYYSSYSATLITLYKALPSAPTSTSEVRAYRFRGDKRLKFYLPDWADTLGVLLPVACSLSASGLNGERYYQTEHLGDEAWCIRTRLATSSLTSEWVYHSATITNVFHYAIYRIELCSLAADSVHTFELEMEFNEQLADLFPVSLEAKDAALWFSQSGLRSPNGFAYLSRKP